MEEMNLIGEVLVQYGLTGILVAYLLYKDWKTTERIINVLDSIQVVLGKLETHHANEGKS